jgi:hypothetical protein
MEKKAKEDLAETDVHKPKDSPEKCIEDFDFHTQLEEEHVFAAGRGWTYMMPERLNLELQLCCWVGKRLQANVEALSNSEQICERVMK